MSDGRDGAIGRVVTVGAAAAGLVAYVYLLGGIVIWLRVTAAQLPGDEGVVAAGSKRLLSIGSRVAAFEALLLIAVGGIVAALVAFASGRRDSAPIRQPASFRDVDLAWRDRASLLGMVGPASALLLLALGFGASGRPRAALISVGAVGGILVLRWMIFRQPNTALTQPHRASWVLRVAAVLLLICNLGVAIGVLPLLEGTILLAGTAVIYAGRFVSWPRSPMFKHLGRELVKSGGVWLAVAAATAVGLAWVATPPVGFSLVTVYRVDRPPLSNVAYIDRNGSGLYLGYCIEGSPGAPGEEPDSARKIRFVPNDEIRELVLDDDQYRFDPGNRPSIGQLVVAEVRNQGPAEGSAPLSRSLRKSADEQCQKG